MKNTNIIEDITTFCSLLPPNIKEHIIDFLKAGEITIAFEELCSYLYEYDINISRDNYDTLVCTGNYLNIDSSYLKPILKLIK
jgi:hypothetical protein